MKSSQAYHDPLEYGDAGLPELCPCCGCEIDNPNSELIWPICADQFEMPDGSVGSLNCRESCAYYLYADDLCEECKKGDDA